MPPPSTERVLEMERRVERDPASLLFAPLAELYRATGRLADAEQTLRAGLERHPEHHSAATALGRVLLEQGRPEDAGVVLAQVVALVPDNLLAVRLLGEAAAASPGAASRSVAARALSPPPPVPPEAFRPLPSEVPVNSARGDRLLSGTLADLYLDQGDQEQGTAILRELVRREPNNPTWSDKLRNAERPLGPPPPTVTPGGRTALEPLPEELWTAGEAEHDDDPITLNVAGQRPAAAPPLPIAAAPAGTVSTDPIVASATLESALPSDRSSSTAGVQRLRAYLARLESYRKAHAL